MNVAQFVSAKKTSTQQASGTNWRVPSGYTVKQIHYAVQHAKTHPLDTYTTPEGRKFSAPQFVGWFRQRLNVKINRNRALYGRKDGGDGYWSDWERHAYQLARQVNTPRLIVREREVALEFRARLKHRLRTSEDF